MPTSSCRAGTQGCRVHRESGQYQLVALSNCVTTPEERQGQMWPKCVMPQPTVVNALDSARFDNRKC